MEDNLARELSDCIAELYEGLDQVRAEMEALKTTHNARSREPLSGPSAPNVGPVVTLQCCGVPGSNRDRPSELERRRRGA